METLITISRWLAKQHVVTWCVQQEGELWCANACWQYLPPLSLHVQSPAPSGTLHRINARFFLNLFVIDQIAQAIYRQHMHFLNASTTMRNRR